MSEAKQRTRADVLTEELAQAVARIARLEGTVSHLSDQLAEVANRQHRAEQQPASTPASSDATELQKMMLHQLMVQNNKSGFTWQRVVATTLIVLATLFLLGFLI